ncbi:uncharacterized protein B0H18DRAFT_952470 [Fomitopsis serialis]|uniref:uncharacterized protein n=1 Tax=Fomitopsis serialis TaxID=139415 RepID=UPI0020074F92|nr:uncharacterized protein B0H18DRAFT_952470 [Neoantrodia serialis]KAH9932377.1 hypothetical protein B0H18DRAFT_952470 [Neoantrodia serialis]
MPTRNEPMPPLCARSRAHSQPPSSPHTDRAPAIRFYDHHRPYYEFTNFAAYAIHWDGRMYHTAEHRTSTAALYKQVFSQRRIPYPVFQAHKFMPDKPELAERIRLLPTSRDALREAGNLRELQRADWFDVNIRVMDDILEAKFAQHLSLRDMLLKTGNTELIEDSTVDSFWGCGQDGQGRNELGKALMRLRDKLRDRPAFAGGQFVWTSPTPDAQARSEGQSPFALPDPQNSRGTKVCVAGTSRYWKQASTVNAAFAM